MSIVKKAVFLVAGLGTRFLPATKVQPKEMFPLVDKPVIQYLVEEAVDAGIKEIILVTSRAKRSLEDHFDVAGELEAFLRQHNKGHLADDVRRIAEMATFTFVRQHEQRGTGDALLAARHLIGDEPFAVFYGDDLVMGRESCLAQLMPIYERYRAPVLALTRMPPETLSRYGVVKGSEISPRLYKVEGVVEKPRVEDAPSDIIRIGRYILTPDILEFLERANRPESGEFHDIVAMEERMRSGGEIYGYLYEGTRYDCGDRLGFLKATVAAGIAHQEVGGEFQEYLQSVLKEK
ncbi:MAG: UTP--glucose-1-phosphate uridylyltransferase [bacterium]|nr:UTP--glucose-1-phosphate uridylyltransferase [bacterium]MDZ4299529.1 UTP--glucose-1-phosphate uridylyltransferase [Candidatus Sungbacteria bacterium]